MNSNSGLPGFPFDRPDPVRFFAIFMDFFGPFGTARISEKSFDPTDFTGKSSNFSEVGSESSGRSISPPPSLKSALIVQRFRLPAVS